METILILVALYLFSVFCTYKYMQVAFSERGIWRNQNAGFAEIFLTFCPVANTIITFIWLIINPYRDTKFNLNWFFKIKK